MPFPPTKFRRHPVIPTPTPSFPRKRESTPRPMPRPGIPGFWIPACAGMTVGAAASIPLQRRHSRPYAVIPAKAGIHTPAYAKSGDTGVLDSGLRRNDGGGVRRPGVGASHQQPSPSGRGLGEGESFCAAQHRRPPHPFILRPAQDERMLPSCQPQPLPGCWIPACAGMTVEAAGGNSRPHAAIPAPTPSFPRKRESTPRLMPTPRIPGFWIPASAGMTVGWRRPPIPIPLTTIDAAGRRPPFVIRNS